MKSETHGSPRQKATGDRTHNGTDPADSRAAGSDGQARSPEPDRSRPEEVNRHVAERIRAQRLLLGLTQQQLGELAGVTYQQMHKYEKGIDRLTAGRLHAIATALGVEVASFFEGLADGPGRQPTPNRRVIGRLAQDFLRLPSQAQQEALAALAHALAATSPATADQPASHDPRSGTDTSLC